MTLFAAWLNLTTDDGDYRNASRSAARRMIAAGEKLFNSAPVQISNVRGLNDNTALGKPSTFTGTCTTCHDTPNIANHSFPCRSISVRVTPCCRVLSLIRELRPASPSSQCPTCRFI